MQGREQVAERVLRLYKDHAESVLRYLLHIGYPADQADDLVQEAFLRLFKALQKGERIEKPKNWLLAVVHHIKVDELRRSNRMVAFDSAEVEPFDASSSGQAATPETELLQLEHAQRLEKAMLQLTERQYQYLILRTEGLKLREIAEIFGVSVQSVAEACTRAIGHLGRVLND